MQPAAVLSVIVEARGVTETRAKLSSVNSELAKTDSIAKKAGTSMTTFGGRAEKVGKTLTKYVAAPMIAVGAASGIMAAKFERSMNLIMTDAGGSVKEVRTLSAEVLKLGEHSEFGPQKLADSLFYVESAGIRGKKAIKDLDEIQRAAMAGNADLEQAVFGVVGAYNALGKEGENIPKILAIMNSVVGHGHLRLEELTAALSTGLVGTAKTFGLSFEGMGSAIAFFTRMSEPAQQAATRMRQTITHLASESTNKAGEAMERIGMNFASMSEKINKTHRLGPIIQELAQHLEGLSEAEKNQVLTEAFGGGRYGTQIREAISNVHLLLKTEKEVADKATIGRLRKAEAEQEKSAMVQIKILWSQLEVMLIRLGKVILPVIVPIFKSIVHWVSGLSEWFGQLSADTKHWIIVIGLVVVAFSILIRVVGGFIKSMGEIVLWFGKTEEANAGLVASNEAVATSYAEITASAEAALAARKEMEYASGPYAGGIQATKLGLPVAEDLAPTGLQSAKAMAGSVAKGLTTGIPGMFAAYGVGNVITSVMSGDMQDAGFEGGGALIGGLAAVLTGNPELAGVGVGVGSLVGEFASKAFSDIFSEESGREMIIKSHQGWMHNYRSQFQHATKAVENTAESVKESSQSVTHARKQDKKVSKEIAQAEQHLTKVTEKYGEGSKGAAIALGELNREKHRGLAATQRLADAEKVHGAVRKAQMNEDRNQVAAAKEFIQKVLGDRQEAAEKLAHIQQTMAPGPEKEAKESAWLKRFKTDSKELHVVAGKMWETIKSAGQEIGPQFAHQLEQINPSLYKLKKAAREAGESVQQHKKQLHIGSRELGVESLGEMASGFKHTKGKAVDYASTMAGPFTNQTRGAFATAAKNAEHFATVTGGAMTETNEQAVHFMEAWGGVAPSKAKAAAGKNKEVVKKARGGHLPGARTGDRIPALLEDGEYVINKEAVKKVGVHQLDKLNFGLAPRFAEGGAVQKAMSEAEAIIGTPYVWGGGHSSFTANGGLDCSGAVSLVLHAAGLLNTPMTSGSLESWGLPGPGPITVHANADHAWMSIMGKPFGTSVDDSSKGLNFYPKPPASYASTFVTRHANVKAAELTGGAHELTEHKLKGTGHLAELGNAQIHGVTAQMQKYLDKHAPGEWGGGNVGEIISGPVVPTMGKTLFAHGANKVGAAGPIGNAYRESLWDPASVGTGGGGLFGFTAGAISLAALQAAAQRAKRPWTDTQFQVEFMLRHGGQDLIPTLNEAASPEQSARIFMEEWERPGIPALGEREAAARKAFNMGYSTGGGVKAKAFAEMAPEPRKKIPMPPATKAGKELQSVGKQLHEGITQSRQGHGPKAGGTIRKAVRKLGKVEGLGDKRIKALVDQTQKIQAYQEYASNASGLNTMEEEPENAAEDWFAKTIFGKFQGQDEGYWLVSELESLGALRNNLLSAQSDIQSPMRVVEKQVKEFKHMMHQAEKHVRQLQRKERDLERDVKKIEKTEKEAIHKLEQQKQEVEKAENLGVHKLEKEKNELEHTLDQLQGAKNPNKGQIANVRSQLATVNEALHNTNKAGADGVKGINETIHNIEKSSHDEIVKDNKQLAHVKKSVAKAEHQVEAYQGFVPELEAKRTTIQETSAGLLSGYQMTDGPYKGKSWEGLTEVQGHVNQMAMVTNLPRTPTGEFGGNILSVEEALQAYSTINNPPPHGSGSGGGGSTNETQEALKQLEREIEILGLQRQMIRQVQGPIMESMSSVKAIAMPYAGPYALGGMVAATVGERGKEIAVMPQGTQMLSHYDAMDAVGGAGATHINFEHLEFHEAEEKVVGRANGQDFDQQIDSYQRKTAKRAARGATPGSRARRGNR